MTAPATAPTGVEKTGQLLAVWRPNAEATVHAPAKTTLHVAALAATPRDPNDPDVVLLPGDVRYIVGQMHPTEPFTVYLYRLP